MDENRSPEKKDFRDQAIKKEARKLKVRQRKEVNAWWGFSLFGLVGWTVTVPALIGVFIGLWIDSLYAGSHKWTLVLLFAGILVGIVSALVLLAKEMFKKEDD